MATSYSQLDPELAKRTRVSHFTLFGIGSLLLLPAAFALFCVVILFHAATSVLMLSTAATSGSGVLAWAALGLLLFKRTYPGWHLAIWPIVLLFGLCAVPSTLIWLAEGSMGLRDSDWITVVLVVALAGGIASLVLSIRNIRLARRSLGRPLPV